jgi:heptosyltransferase-2
MNIAVFLPNWIGDVVMATPAIRAVRQHFSGAHLTAICKPYVTGVLDGLTWFDDQLFLDKKGWWQQRLLGVAWTLRKRGIEIALLLPNSLRSGLVAWLGGCRRRVGYNRYGRGPLLTDKLSPILDAFGKIKPSPVIDAYNLLATTVGCSPPGHQMELATTTKDEIAVVEVWDRGRFQHCREVICLNPGAAYGAAKYWPTEYFASLAQKLVDQRGSGILVLCGPKEKELARHIVALARRDSIHTLAEHPQSIGLTKACVRRADLLITTDSGPRHFAAAFAKPVVSLFGPTHIPWTITYHPKEICLQKKVPCGPCQLRVCPLDHRCMKELLPQDVFFAATELLGRFPARPVVPVRKAS